MMTQTKLVRRIKFWQEKLFLQRWTIEASIVDEVEGAPGALASCNRASDYDDCKMQFRADLTAEDDLFWDHLITHELVHLLTREVEVYSHHLCDQVAPIAAEMYDDTMLHFVEGLVDRISKIAVSLERS